MSKGVFGHKLGVRDFIEPLVVLPFVFWGLFWFENGFSWIVAVLGAVLFFVVLPCFIVWRE